MRTLLLGKLATAGYILVVVSVAIVNHYIWVIIFGSIYMYNVGEYYIVVIDIEV